MHVVGAERERERERASVDYLEVQSTSSPL